MKTIKILGIFLFQKLKEVGQILIWKQNWRTPESVVIWVRTLIYTPIALPLYYYIGVATCYIMRGKISFEGEPWVAGVVGIGMLFCGTFAVVVIWIFLFKNLVSDFKRWFSSNWKEAKRKVEEKK